MKMDAYSELIVLVSAWIHLRNLVNKKQERLERTRMEGEVRRLTLCLLYGGEKEITMFGEADAATILHPGRGRLRENGGGAFPYS